MRRIALILLWLSVVACGGGPTPPATQPPTQPTAPPAPPLPVNTWSVAGTLVDTAGRQPIGGATIAPSWDLASVQTDGPGKYELGAVSNPPTTPYKVTVSGGDLISRELWITWQRGPRIDVTIDAIRNIAPFNLEFYRQLVRGTYDQADAPWPNLRWVEAPRFYLQTVDQNNQPIEPEVLPIVREALARGVREFSGGRLSAAAIESGPEPRPAVVGWIRVNIVRDRNAGVCGRAPVGANPGTITLYSDVCTCGSNKVPAELVLHEVGHAMGFFHVPERRAVMHPSDPIQCGPSELSAAEKFHAAVAYSRQRGNRDPDIDPSSTAFLVPSAGVIVEEPRLRR